MALYRHLKIKQVKILKIIIQSSIQVVDLVNENFSYKIGHMQILPIFVIEGTAFIWILYVPSNNQGRQILYMIKSIVKVAYYKVHYSKLDNFFVFKISHRGNKGNL